MHSGSGALAIEMEPPLYEQILFETDSLPKYQCTLDLTGRLLCKHELATPDVQAVRRRWCRVEAALRGTMLILREVVEPERLATNKTIPARRFRSYTLQAGDAGLATDNNNEGNAFRVRVEGEQLLFVAPGPQATLLWVESLLMAISISEPLETREMPTYPNPFRRRGSPAVGTVTTPIRKRLRAVLAPYSSRRREWLFSGQIQARKIVSVGSALRCQCPHSSCWRNESRTEASREEAHEEGKFEGSDDKWRSFPEQSMRYIRSLTKWSKWNGVYYIKDERRVQVPPHQARLGGHSMT